MTHDVVIVGAGPAGLAAAHALRRAGLRDVVLLEREPTPGGVPRYCAHPGFGLADFSRPLSGPAYARALAARVAGMDLRTGTAVLGIEPDGVLRISGTAGLQHIAARAVLLATGAREAPRSARLVSGTRPWGVTSTGTLQEIACTTGRRPFARPVIVGSEWVAFSNLATARHLGIRPVALLEADAAPRVPRLAAALATAAYGVQLWCRTSVEEILGADRVEGVLLACDGASRVVPCDGVIFSGDFVPEAALLRAAGIDLDPGTQGPAIDQLWRCAAPGLFAAGNVLRAVESAGWASGEGRQAAAAILRVLAGGAPPRAAGIAVRHDRALRYVQPQIVHPDAATGGRVVLHARAAAAVRGELRVLADGVPIARRLVAGRAEARLTIGFPAAALRGRSALEVMLA